MTDPHLIRKRSVSPVSSLTFFPSNNVSFLPNSLFLGFHFNCTPKPASLSQTPMRSAPPSFLPFRPSGPPLLGCCEAPAVSLAEAQQELQMLQKQLGERSEHCCLGVLMRGGPHGAALHGFGWMGVKGRLGTCPRWQMEGKLARFLSEMQLLLSLGCVPSATGGIQTLSTWCSQTVRHNTVWQHAPRKSGKCLTAGGIKQLCFALAGWPHAWTVLWGHCISCCRPL